MAEGRLIGAAQVTGTLVKVDWYPGLVLEGGTSVMGEVYEVGPELLRELDIFEGIKADSRSSEYARVRAEVNCGEKVLSVWIYEWLKGVEGYEVVSSGNWLSVDL